MKTSLPPARQLKTSYFGINGSKFFHVPEQRDTAVQQRLRWMHELGIRWDRCDLWWHVVEPQPGKWDFSRPDLIFDTLAAADVQWYPILCYGAAWFPDGRTAPESDADFAGFAEYVKRIVSRYRGRAPMWSVWNEPNISEFWNPTPDPAAYTRLLKDAYAAIKSADPAALVAAPAIAPLGPWDRDFVEALYRHGAKAYFDVFDYHYYRNTAPEDEVPAEIAAIQAVIHRNADHKPIIISESGVSTLALRAQGLNAKQADQRQAAYVVRNQLLCLALGVEQFFYFDLQNWYDDTPHDWASQLGLVTAAGKPKPAFHALKTLVSLTDHRRFVGRCHDLGAGIEGVLVHDERADQYTLALWATTDTPQEFTVSLNETTAELVEPLGQRRALRAQKDRQITLKLNQQPRYVIGVDPQVYLRDAGIRFAAQHVIIAPGETQPLTIQRDAELSDLSLRSLVVDAPAGLTWNPAHGTLTASDEVVPGRYRVTTRLKLPERNGQPASEIVREALVEVIATVDVSLLLDGAGDSTKAVIRIENRTDVPLTRPLRLIDETSQRVVHEFETLTIPANSAHEAECPLTPDDFDAVRGLTTWRATFGPAQSKPLRILSLKHQAPITPTIDGRLNEWQQRPAITLDHAQQVFHSPQPWRAADASGRFWLEFGEEALTLAASVQDDDPLFNHVTPGEMWMADSVEFFLGVCGPTTRGVIKHACEYQIGIAPTTANDKPAVVWFHADRHLREAEVAVRKTSVGYDLEASIPYTALELEASKLAEIQLLGLSVNLNDRDGEDFAPAGVHPGLRMSWTGSASNWIRPSDYGLLILR